MVHFMLILSSFAIKGDIGMTWVEPHFIAINQLTGFYMMARFSDVFKGYGNGTLA